MAISHIKSNIIADFTGTVTVFNSAGSTQTVEASQLVRPSDWNSVHNQYLTLSGNTAGASTMSGSNIILHGGNNVTLSANGDTLVISGGAGGAGMGISAGTQSVSTGTMIFADSNGLAFGMSGSSQITGSYTQSTHSHATAAFSGSNGSFTANTVTFGSSNGAHFYTTNGSIVASYTVPTQSVVPGIQTIAFANTTFTTGAVSFSNANGISFGSSGAQVTASHNALTSQSNQAFSADASSTFQTLTFQNSNGFTFSNNAGAIRASYSVPVVSNAIQSVGSATGSGTNTSRFAADDHVHAGVFSMGVSTGGNTAGNTRVDVGRFVFFGSNITLSQDTAAGALNTIVISAAAPGAAAITQSFGISTATAGGSTAGTTGMVNGDDIQYLLVPGSNITMSQSINGSSGTLTIFGPSGGGAGTISSYEPFPLISNIAMTFNGASISHGVAFRLDQNVSASFIRIPVLMTTGSTTVATLASATATASASIVSTFNAVIYSVGVGASSRSLMSVASASAGFTMLQSISISNSTQYSITLGVSQQANGGGTTRTTQYSISNTNYSFTTQQIVTAFSGTRFIDIPFASSLSPGAYWMVMGISTASAAGGPAGLSVMTNCNVRYSAHYGIAQANVVIGVMGSTNVSSGGPFGAGSFSTAGGGTTSAFPMSAISSSASHGRPYFQLLRSA